MIEEYERKQRKMIIKASIYGERPINMFTAMNCHFNQDLSTLRTDVLGLHSNKAINGQTRLGHSYEHGKGTNSEHIGLIRVGKYEKR